MSKVLTESALLRALNKERRRGKRIVAVNGSFDVLHAGHARTLFEAKRLGDVLVVLINTDESVRAYKGPGRPYVSEEERTELVSALSPVNYVCLFNDLTPVRILERVKPDVLAKSSEWGADCVEREVIERGGGRVRVLSWLSGRSTTDLIERAIQAREKPSARAVFLDRDGTINDNGEGYLYKPGDMKFLPGAIPALHSLSKAGYKLIIITNQSGIGRGYFAKSDLGKLHRWMLRTLRAKGVRLDAIYHCPHSPDALCKCRKPGIALLLKAARRFRVNLSKSWVVGDDDKDIWMGRQANVRTIKIGRRLPVRHRTQTGLPPKLAVQPHHYARDLSAAAKIILGNRKINKKINKK